MSFDDYLPHLFRLIDEDRQELIRLAGPLRHHGRAPNFADSEVLARRGKGARSNGVKLTPTT